jgi:NADH dehydrogenase
MDWLGLLGAVFLFLLNKSICIKLSLLEAVLADLSLLRVLVWKPKLHEIASGSMDFGDHEVDYMAHAHWNHFVFRIGELRGLDRENKTIDLAPYLDTDNTPVTPVQKVSYDTLVICIGSLSNDFGTTGVKDFALKLENQTDAKLFHSKMVNACIRAHHQSDQITQSQLHVAIIGAGATGVELAAELHRTTREVVAFGLDGINADKDLKISLIEAADRILPALNPRLSNATEQLLSRLGVHVHTKSKVMEVTPKGIKLADGQLIESELVVWAAGVKAPEYLKNFGGLETNRLNQLVALPAHVQMRRVAVAVLFPLELRLRISKRVTCFTKSKDALHTSH